MLALDSEYRRRHQLFHLADGSVKDSREINWRNVEWESVVMIEVFILDKKHVVTCENHNFKFFMNFRNAGQTWEDNKKVPIHEWCIGWSDGMQIFMKEIDFFTGELVKEFVAPVAPFKNHIHPRVRNVSSFA